MTTAAPSEVTINIGQIVLEGYLAVPKNATGIVLFAHGSGSSRDSPRNQQVAQVLRDHNIATLLFDLLSVEEEVVDSGTRELRFDIDLLAKRLASVTDWVFLYPEVADLKLGYFGASTGAAAALTAAGEDLRMVDAIVSRGGRPDLAQTDLTGIQVPTLLIVGGRDKQVIEMNNRVLPKLAGEKKLAIVPNATHLFEEPGTLEEVAKLAADWFQQHFS